MAYSYIQSAWKSRKKKGFELLGLKHIVTMSQKKKKISDIYIYSSAESGCVRERERVEGVYLFISSICEHLIQQSKEISCTDTFFLAIKRGMIKSQN